MDHASMIHELGIRFGEDRFKTDPCFLEKYSRNVTAAQRRIRGVVYPGSTEEVLDIVLLANRFGVPIYPVSTGKNWGLGSRLPVRDDAIVVDLKKMNRIRYIDAKHGYAIVEPGVTQGDLYDHLKRQGLPFIFNVTGSATTAGLIGNALDRGVGYFGSRADSTMITEIVLGNGTVLEPGFFHYSESKARCLYRHGVGPSIEGLFFQSNYGIVTAASVELIPIREQHAVLFCGIKNETDLSRLVDAVARIRMLEVVTTALHIASRHRAEISFAPILYARLLSNGFGDKNKLRPLTESILRSELGNAWTVVGGLMGTKADVQNAYRYVKAMLGGYASVKLITQRKIQSIKQLSSLFQFLPSVRKKRLLLEALEPVFGLALGIPTDETMGSVFWPVRQEQTTSYLEPDQGNCGLLSCLPMVPLDGQSVLEVVGIVNDAFERYEFNPYMTFNVVSRCALEGVLNLAFDRSDAEEVKRAFRCIDECHERLTDKGYIPYRVGLQSMKNVVRADDDYWRVVSSLKDVLDPNRIIAPGRYSLV